MFQNKLFFLYELKEKSLQYGFFRLLFLLYTLGKTFWFLSLKRNHFQALCALLRFERDISSVDEQSVPQLVHYLQRKVQDRDGKMGNIVLTSYLNSDDSRMHRKRYASFGKEDLLRIRQLKKNADPERQGDLLILKPYVDEHEKGVIFLQFDDTVYKFVSIYDVEQVARYYRIVIEPSAWGYQNPIFHLLLNIDTEVIIEAQYKQDFDYINRVNSNLYAIRLGAGDWVDPDLFKTNDREKKEYDLVMNANWAKWKRHKLLFQSLRTIRDDIGKVALIGYPMDGITLKDIRRLSNKYGVADRIDFFERIPPEMVSRIVRRSKMSVMLSKKEGANRGIYESFFSNVPVILTSKNIGVNRDHVNHQTGMVVDDDTLPKKILFMLENYTQFTPEKWALENTGYMNSSRKLNDFIREIAESKGERWTEDIFMKKNVPVAMYSTKSDRLEADKAMDHLALCLRR